MSSNNTKTGLKQRTCITLAALLAVLAQGADAATQTHTATFNGAGGDAQVGYGATADPTYNLAVYDVLPLFDAGLGTLERVSYTLSGWRSFDGVCSSPVYAENPGACSARIDGAFYLEYMNLNAWPQTVAMADIRPLRQYSTILALLSAGYSPTRWEPCSSKAMNASVCSISPS